MSLTQTRAETKTNHAARVTRRIKGDLLALQTLYSCCTTERVDNLAHDIELGLDHSALSKFAFYLKKGTEIHAAYEYVVNENGELEVNDRSGRIDFKADLVGASLYVFVTWKEAWHELKKEGKLIYTWGEADTPNISHLTSAASGAYSSGNLGVSRTSYTRH